MERLTLNRAERSMPVVIEHRDRVRKKIQQKAQQLEPKLTRCEVTLYASPVGDGPFGW